MTHAVQLLISSLILLGLVQLVCGLCEIRRILQAVSQGRGKWRVLAGLISGFVIGYLCFLVWAPVQQEHLWLLCVVALVFAGGGTFVFAVTRLSANTIREVKRLAALEHENKRIGALQERLQTVLDNAAEGIITLSADGRIESFNKTAEQMFDYAHAEVAGRKICTLVSRPDGTHCDEETATRPPSDELPRLVGREVELVGRRRDGSTFPLALKVSAMTLDGRRAYAGLLSDISERKTFVAKLERMANHDGLTGLCNRTKFQRDLQRALERVRRFGDPFNVLYVDLDNFKCVNDTLGHAAGDRLLVDVARLLAENVRRSDVVARFGGDEFTVLLASTTTEQALRIAESLRSRFKEHAFHRGAEHVDVGCSIGVAAGVATARSAEDLLAQADFACHLAKRAGRNCVRVFNTEHEASKEGLSLEMGWSRRIKQALEAGRFALAAQPIVAVATRRVHSFEVLVRMWEDGQLIMPGGFLPAAERFGLAREIDHWVIGSVIDRLAIEPSDPAAPRYAVNLSAQTLSDDVVCELVRLKLRQSGVHPARLSFEITETTAISDMRVAERVLCRLREMGCHTALDDFGVGMSSFAYLRELAVDAVKIDGRFVRNLAQSVVDQGIVRAMNDIAHTLGKSTVAEFVEDEPSLALLAQFSVDYAQGYHVGRPQLLPALEPAASERADVSTAPCGV
jgi:diguanylate cyclase (GGDEF)-like protein/PAS domain S-box-containing protein